MGYKKHIIKDFIPESFNNISFDQKNNNFENVDENLSKTIDLSTIIVDNISIKMPNVTSVVLTTIVASRWF